jgi:hypothetical protein
MSFFSWLHNRTSTLSPRSQARPRPAAERFQPRLEILEDRAVPATFSAATASALIQDIQTANQQGGANTIVLTAPTTSPYALTSVNNSTDGPTVLPQIANGNNLTILTSNGTTTPGYGDVLDAGKYGRLFDVAVGGSLTLENVTLQNGKVFTPGAGTGATEKGGAISNQGTLVLDQVMVQDNAVVGMPGYTQAAAGGGVWSNGALTVENSTVFQGNSATGSSGSPAKGGNAYGGALCIAGGTASISNSFFGSFNQPKGNTAQGGQSNTVSGSGYGGAVYVAAGTVTLNADTVGNSPGISGATSNAALGGGGVSYGYGGGLYVAGGTVTLTNDTIVYNQAGSVQNSLVNTSMGQGGGLFIASGATVSLDSFTVAHVEWDRPQNIDGTYVLLS